VEPTLDGRICWRKNLNNDDVYYSASSYRGTKVPVSEVYRWLQAARTHQLLRLVVEPRQRAKDLYDNNSEQEMVVLAKIIMKNFREWNIDTYANNLLYELISDNWRSWHGGHRVRI